MKLNGGLGTGMGLAKAKSLLDKYIEERMDPKTKKDLEDVR